MFVIGGYSLGWTWAGLAASHHSDTINPAKTLWDWMQLLIVPLSLAVATLWFGEQQHKRDQHATEAREQAAVLKTYFDTIGELLLNKHLRESQVQDEVRQIAHAHTSTALNQLGPEQTPVLLRFLQEARLFSIVSLEGVNLRKAKLSVSSTSSASDYTPKYLIDASYEEAQLEGANLSEVQLNGANLRKTNLKRANLSGASLIGADLSESDLSDADLSGADLRNAILCRANLMQTKFKGVNLESANLQGIIEATFHGADSYDLIGELKRDAKLRGAKMPDGSVYN